VTKIAGDKFVVRETHVLERTRPIIVELKPRLLELRLKGTQERFVLPYDVALDFARKRTAAQTRAVQRTPLRRTV
jgi:hypothetical protein